MSHAAIDELFALFAAWGHDPYDEAVSQLDHALQTAALAIGAAATDGLVAAALLHDVGHLLERADSGPFSPATGDLHHEAVGARYLASWFPAAVTGTIANHVRAKRYLCAVRPSYASTLSAGSTASLARQGGPLSPIEAERFEAMPGYQDAVRLREWDDAAKIVGLEVAPLESYREMLDRLI